ncbi:hypothetical protein Clacol_008084 [Clathrus columnatus]|uniref:Vacuolar protein sorting-associated protein 27 n=1 Tax=Clathrus columnatus TaxID=1419009 RepID=A0AAV5AJF7_9AGAM|nr:hypothetical protein Clacol_008084 [Clathrus columnatus]
MNMSFALSHSLPHSAAAVSIPSTIPTIARTYPTFGLTSTFQGPSRSASSSCLSPVTSSLWVFFQPTRCRRTAEHTSFNAEKGIRSWRHGSTSTRVFPHSATNPRSCSHLRQSWRFQSGYSPAVSHLISPHEPPLANSPPVVIPDKDEVKLGSKLNLVTPNSDTTRESTELSAQSQTRTKPRSRLRPSKAAISLTPDAVSRLRSLLNGPTPQFIRIGVRNKGCAGMSYHLDYVQNPGRFDEVVEQDGVKVLIDSKALFSIIGSEMDWKEDRLSSNSLIWGQSQFDEAVDKATSELRLGEEDIALNLEICDQIRSKSVPPKDAVRALKRRLNHKNPNVQLLTLGLIDVCVKNGGDHFLNEVASKEFMDNLASILKMKDLNFEVKNKILKLIQNWSIAFEGKYTLGYVGQVYKDLKSSGFQFPPKDLTVANSAMIDTSTAPEWIDSDVCLKCRDPFTFINRKHHCRNCGGVYDHRCSSKSMSLPHFGITQEVRVCDSCHTKLNKNSRDKERPQSVDFSRNASHSRQESISRKRRSVRDFSDADLQRAIQLSLQDASGSSSRPSRLEASEPPLYNRKTRPNNRTDEEDDAELQAAIQASLREAALRPSAPLTSPADEYNGHTYRNESLYNEERYNNKTPTPSTHPPLPSLPNHDLNPSESDAILMFSQTVHDARSQGNTDISRIPNVHELYNQASSLRPKLALNLDETGRKEEMLSEMHEKLSEAVKLYDNILTEQLSRPTWRSFTVPRSYGYAQQPQWPATRVISPVQSQVYVPAAPPPIPVMSTRPIIMQQPQHAYPTSPPPVTQTSGTAYYGQEPQQNQPYQQPISPVSTLPPHLNSLQPSGHSNSSTQEQWSQPNSESYQLIHGASGTVPPQTYSQAQHYVSSTYNPISSTSPSSMSQSQQQIYSPVPEQPRTQEYPPPIVQQHQQPSPPLPTLSRHNTLSQALSPTPFVPITGQTAAPSPNTIPYHNTSVSQPQVQQPYNIPSEYPSFPTAPTSNPISMSLYSPPNSGFEQPEQKEVLLIDL